MDIEAGKNARKEPEVRKLELSMYEQPPNEDVELEQLERWGMDRLKGKITIIP